MSVPAQAEAGGKIILFGEHFVVHGVPALAIPISGVRTRVQVAPGSGPLHLETSLVGPARATAERVLQTALELLDIDPATRWVVRAFSDIPIGYGLGSSAAFGCALITALAAAADRPLASGERGRLAHELERVVHGRPSGIDDTVVTSGRAVWFERGQPPVSVDCRGGISLILASCGYPGPTAEAVAAVGAWGQANPARFAEILEEARELSEAGRAVFEAGDSARLGTLADANHALLREVGVSTPELEKLVKVARQAGALGAKLTGSGLGGFVVVLARSPERPRILAALRDVADPILEIEVGDTHL